MKTILKKIEINEKNDDHTKELLIKNSLYSSSIKWFKGCRFRGIR